MVRIGGSVERDIEPVVGLGVETVREFDAAILLVFSR